MKEKCYYMSGYNDGYVVKSRYQGDCRVATFVCESDADDFIEYRNRMLKKHNTTDTSKYKGGNG